MLCGLRFAIPMTLMVLAGMAGLPSRAVARAAVDDAWIVARVAEARALSELGAELRSPEQNPPAAEHQVAVIKSITGYVWHWWHGDIIERFSQRPEWGTLQSYAKSQGLPVIGWSAFRNFKREIDALLANWNAGSYSPDRGNTRYPLNRKPPPEPASKDKAPVIPSQDDSKAFGGWNRARQWTQTHLDALKRALEVLRSELRRRITAELENQLGKEPGRKTYDEKFGKILD